MKKTITIIAISLCFILVFFFGQKTIDFFQYFFNPKHLIRSSAEDFSIKKDYIFLEEKEIIELINKERQVEELAPLSENRLLNESAKLKAKEMIEEQYFSHYSMLNKGIDYYVKKAGYEGVFLGENLAMGNFKNEKKLVGYWMESFGHRKNILNPDYNETGVSIIRGNFNGLSTLFIVQHFALSF